MKIANDVALHLVELRQRVVRVDHEGVVDARVIQVMGQGRHEARELLHRRARGYTLIGRRIGKRV